MNPLDMQQGNPSFRREPQAVTPRSSSFRRNSQRRNSFRASAENRIPPYTADGQHQVSQHIQHTDIYSHKDATQNVAAAQMHAHGAIVVNNYTCIHCVLMHSVCIPVDCLCLHRLCPICRTRRSRLSTQPLFTSSKRRGIRPLSGKSILGQFITLKCRVLDHWAMLQATLSCQ